MQGRGESFSYPIELSAVHGGRFESLRALVDTASSYSVVPATILASLGVQPQWTGLFSTADGLRQEMPLAEVRIRVDGRERTTICVFGSPESVPTLGSYALAGLALEADPATRRLTTASLFLP
ncbi:MAG: hypothetical protein IH870_01520 [Chloroflexi bacterium]|nr:hypothetical protein [Chloroflexota bacterium]